jgi:hypothetical protein
VRHTGTLSAADGEMVQHRWPTKMAALAELLKAGTARSGVDLVNDKHPGAEGNT